MFPLPFLGFVAFDRFPGFAFAYHLFCCFVAGLAFTSFRKIFLKLLSPRYYSA